MQESEKDKVTYETPNHCYAHYLLSLYILFSTFNYMSKDNNRNTKKNFFKKNFTVRFYRWGSTATVYFLPLGSQKFLVLTLSTSEGWKAESTLEPASGFEHGTPGLGIQRLKVWNISKVNNKDTRTKPLASFWCLCC